MWSATDVSFELIDDDTDDPVVTARLTTPVGQVMVMAEVEERGRTLVLRRLHMHADRANQLGPANLRLLAQVVMERMDWDAIEIEGAVRTTGASPGRRPHPLRFARRSGVEADW